MAEQGWIKLYRKLQDDWVWNDKPYSKGQAWIDLILSANYKDNTVVFDGKPLTVKRGQFITSIKKLCAAWGWSNTKVRNFLKVLEGDKKILLKTAPRKATAITIINYSVYQDRDVSKSISETSQEHINNKDKNYKNIYDDDIHSVSIYIRALQNVTGKEVSSSQIEKFLRTYGADNMDLVIRELGKSEWLRANIKFSRINTKFLHKIKIGFYRDDQPVKRKPKTKFNNFEGHTDNWSDKDFEDIARKKIKSQLKDLEESK